MVLGGFHTELGGFGRVSGGSWGGGGLDRRGKSGPLIGRKVGRKVGRKGK